MNSSIERLLSLRVVDVMKRDVICISANATMADAAKTLVSHEVSGAPVIDEQGYCVGILTRADFVARDMSRDASGRLPPRDEDFVLVQDDPAEPLHIEQVADVSVIFYDGDRARLSGHGHMEPCGLYAERSHVIRDL